MPLDPEGTEGQAKSKATFLKLVLEEAYTIIEQETGTQADKHGADEKNEKQQEDICEGCHAQWVKPKLRRMNAVCAKD